MSELLISKTLPLLKSYRMDVRDEKDQLKCDTAVSREINARQDYKETLLVKDG